MKGRIIEIVELGQPQSLIQRENAHTTELLKTDLLVKELNEQLRLYRVVGQGEQLICDTCKSGLIDYPDIYRRTCRCGRLGSTCTNTMLYAGQTVRLTTSDEEHRGKYFKVIEVLDDLVKVEWQKRIYFFYCTELEVVKSCI